jgi:CspA family cold shock protein
VSAADGRAPVFAVSVQARRGALAVTLECDLLDALGADDAAMRRALAGAAAQALADATAYAALLRSQKEHGVVKWFDDRKGYGFLNTARGDLFVHWRGIAGAGFRTLAAGQRVRFFRRPGVSGDGGAADQAVEVEPAPVATPAGAAPAAAAP